jgi:hypothetical protein
MVNPGFKIPNPEQGQKFRGVNDRNWAPIRFKYFDFGFVWNVVFEFQNLLFIRGEYD